MKPLRRPPVSRAISLAAALTIALAAFDAAPARAAEPVAIRDTVPAIETPEIPATPAQFRLAGKAFDYEQRRLGPISDQITLSLVTFPSPVTTNDDCNNTVHCEYYRPTRAGPADRAPGVIVLHILGGDFPLSRLFCNVLAQRGVAALFLKMPYYGPRRPPGASRRMVSEDPYETAAGVTQAVLDVRRATTWLASRDEIDAEQLGVCGISLGGITGALATSVEPRLKNACLLLAGGDVSRVIWDAPQMDEVRRRWQAKGKTREEFFAVLKPIDPVTYAGQARGRRILMLNAKADTVVPPACTVSLWNAFGQPEIVWYDGGHYTAMRHIFDALDRVPSFFAGGGTE